MTNDARGTDLQKHEKHGWKTVTPQSWDQLTDNEPQESQTRGLIVEDFSIENREH